MASYRAGTVTVTQGSKIITGVDTAFNVVGIYAGDIFSLVDGNNIPTGSLYEVASVESDTKLTLLQAYQGTSGSAKNYVIMNMAGNQTTPRFSAKVSNLLGEIQPIADGLSEDAIPSGIPKADANGKLADGWLHSLAGATASQAGAVGLVPAPAAGKQGSYLMGNGTWGRDADVLSAISAGQIGDAENIVGSSLDVDTLMAAGKYYLNGTGTYLNLPSGITLGYLTVHSVTTGGPVQQILTTHTRRMYMRAKTSSTAAWTEWVNVAPPYAQTGEGIGQWVKIDIQDGSAYSLPDGGRWEYFLQLFSKTDGGLYSFASGVSAGGTSLTSGSDAYRYVGFAKRVE